jgi:hypothetical protein
MDRLGRWLGRRRATGKQLPIAAREADAL